VFRALCIPSGTHFYLLDQWGPEITDFPELRLRSHFEPWALGGSDNHGENDNPNYWTLDSLMRHNGACFLVPSPC